MTSSTTSSSSLKLLVLCIDFSLPFLFNLRTSLLLKCLRFCGIRGAGAFEAAYGAIADSLGAGQSLMRRRRPALIGTGHADLWPRVFEYAIHHVWHIRVKS